MSAHRPGIRRITATALLVLATLAGALFTAAPSDAFEGYTLIARLGSEGTGNGQFKEPYGVAVNETTGNLYVADSGNNRVEEISSTGAYIAQFNGGPEHTLSNPRDIAIDNSNSPAKGDVYIENMNLGTVDVFDETGKYLRQLPSQEGLITQGMAVDGSGDVWLSLKGRSLGGEFFTLIKEFDDTGKFITQFQPSAEMAPGFAVDSQGSIYFGNVANQILKFNAKLEEVSSLAGASGDSQAIAANPVTGSIFIDTKRHAGGQNEIVENSKIVACPPFAEPPECGEVFGEVEGLKLSYGIAVDGAGTVFASEFGSGRVGVFKFVLLADVATGAASAVERTTATVSGMVKRDGKPATYHVQYGEGGEGSSLALSTPAVNIEGEGEEEVSVDLSKLRAATMYSYRLVTENENGARYGEVETLTTLPPVEGLSTGPAVNVGVASAKLTGTLEPNGFDTHYHFVYGESTSYGQVSPALPGTDAGSAVEKAPAASELSGLIPDTTYHFALVGENVFGATQGQDETLTTQPREPAVAIMPASYVSPTSAVLNATVNPEHSGDTHCHIVLGATESYGTSVPAEGIDLGSGYGEMAVAKSIGGLQPGTTYHYAVLASNPVGTVQSADETFTTPGVTLPVVVSGAASGVSQEAATISGTVESRGVPTSYEFDLGTDTTYGSRVFGAAASTSGVQSFSLALAGLTAGTTYHYRIAATNVYGTSYGADQTFTTPGFPTALLAAPATTVLVPSLVFAPFSTVGASAGEAPVKIKAKPKKRHNARKKTRRKGRKAARAASGSRGGGRGGVGR